MVGCRVCGSVTLSGYGCAGHGGGWRGSLCPWRQPAAQPGGHCHERACPPLARRLGLSAEEPVPDDRYHAIYFAMLLAGVGFLLPYNSFITDVDYLHHKYPGGPQLRPAVHTALLARLGPAASRNPRAAPCSGGPLSSNSSSAVNCCVTPGQPLALSGSLAPLGQREEAVLCGGRCSGRGSFEPRLPPQRPPPPAGTSIVFDMSLTYILVALVAVLLNNALVERLSLHTRITAGTLPAAHRLPASPLATTHPSIPCASLSLSVRWVRLLLGKENQVGLVGCSACRHDARSWGGCCVPHMCPGALALPCFFSTICLHGNIQLQSPAQKAPPPGSLPGAPLRPLRCPALPVLRGTAEREHSDLALCGGEGAPPAHCSLLSALASPHPGYLLALGPLLFISICDVWLQLFSRDQAYAINLAAVGTVAFGCTGRARGLRWVELCAGGVLYRVSQAQSWCVFTCTRVCPLSHITHCTPTGLCALGTQCRSTRAAHMSTRPSLMWALRHLPGFLRHQLCFTNSQAYIPCQCFSWAVAFQCFKKKAFYFETISHL